MTMKRTGECTTSVRVTARKSFVPLGLYPGALIWDASGTFLKRPTSQVSMGFEWVHTLLLTGLHGPALPPLPPSPPNPVPEAGRSMTSSLCSLSFISIYLSTNSNMSTMKSKCFVSKLISYWTFGLSRHSSGMLRDTFADFHSIHSQSSSQEEYIGPSMMHKH